MSHLVRDHFKDINNQYGHPHGDAVLIGAANVLSGACRISDVLGRYGGQNFF